MITLRIPTDEQASAVIAALDLYTRMSLGQIEELAYLMRCGEIKPRDDKGDDDRWLCDIEAALARVKTLLGHPQGGSFGVGSPKVSSSAHRCYEIKKVLAQVLAMKRNPRPDFPYVDYDGLFLRYTKDPAPTAHSEVPTGVAEALKAIEDALPKADERETVNCVVEGTHLRAAYEALRQLAQIPNNTDKEKTE